MTTEQRLRNLAVPQGRADVVLDTDAYNEADDQFAIAYLLRSREKLRTCALYAAPFFNTNSDSPADGMRKSYEEIRTLLSLMKETDVPVFPGSETYLSDEKTPVPSPAAEDLAVRAMAYSPEHPLYVVAIGAITNVASALLLQPAIAENIVVVWLGGHARHFHDTREFNMRQDIAAARVVMGCGVPFVQLPCMGVVSTFAIAGAELEQRFSGKGALADYLIEKPMRDAAGARAADKPWSRILWDVTAVGWLLNDGNRFMLSRVVPTALPTYDGHYTATEDGTPMRYVYHIQRDALFCDLIKKLVG